MTDREVDFSELAGDHMLSGVDSAEIPDGYGEAADCINFVIDGKTYSALEDLSDGYRSYLRYLVHTETIAVINVFPPIAVRIEAADDGGSWAGLRFFDAANGEEVLTIGTCDADDYYPSCIMAWHPELLHVNEARN